MTTNKITASPHTFGGDHLYIDGVILMWFATQPADNLPPRFAPGKGAFFRNPYYGILLL